MLHTVINRNEAHAAMLKRYFTGIPCKLGHVAERYVSTGGCTECLGRFRKNEAMPITRTLTGYRPTRPLWVASDMHPDNVPALDAYLQRCTNEFTRSLGLMTQERQDAVDQYVVLMARKNVKLP